MFGGTKPTFGTSTTGTGFGSFNNTAASSPFGQSAFGKPATSAFGAAPTFGTQQTTPSLFGSNAAQPQTSGLFGGASTSAAFGGTTTTNPAFGNFAQPQQSTSIFGTSQPQANSSSLFGQPAATSAFGSAVKPAGLGSFGQSAAQPSTSLFGQPAASTSASGFGTFGQTAPTTTSVFGSATTSAFGQPANAATAANPGTSIAKYQPTIGTDTLMKAGQPNSVNTKQHCITAMKEYEGKSLEELRMEDYLANRKGPQAGSTSGFGGFGGTTPATTGTGLFGATAQPSGLFGQPAGGTTENKVLFGSNTSAFGQPAAGGFGATATQPFGATKPFGATGTTVFGASATDSSNPFGAKPAFGQTAAPSLFGQNPATSAAPAFSQTTSGFGTGFGTPAGQQQQQQPSLFGQPASDANKTAFGLGQTSTGNTGFGAFGTAATSTASGGLFGAKNNTGFGAAPAFGTSQANTGFQNFCLNNSNVGGGGLFNTNLNKPTTSGFGPFGTNTSTSAPLNFNAGTGQTSLFGNTTAKPGGLFGTSLGSTTNTTGGGLFAQTGQSVFGLGNQTRGFGQTAGDGSLNTLGGLPGAPQQQQQIPIHQQILSKMTSPYGDNAIFKDLKRNEENDPAKATNPAAQKAIMENTGNSGQQFKISSNSSPSIIKIKPIGSALTKKSLFDGLEEFDASVESFSLKPNAKRLILKPKNNNSTGGAVSGQQAACTVSNTNTPQRQQTSLSSSNVNNNNNNGNQQDVHNESIAGETSLDSSSLQPVATGNNVVLSNAPPTLDASRRESWLHPNNLEKVRQQNISAGVESGSSHNSTLTELVPRKPLDTYRSGTATGRFSVSTVPENPFEEENRILSKGETSNAANETVASSNLSYAAEEKSILIDDALAEYEEHPTGITLKRVGYYTIPSLDDLKSFLAEDGSCVVPNFTVGREGYGNVHFGKEIDVAGLNLDEIVHFRNKEIIIYPDDDNKPPVGHGLNREAQVTLDQVWPLDKSKHEPIKDPLRLLEMDWEGKLRRVCDKNETRFIEYRPETGSWVFRVKHFSKYGLNDSDEDEYIPTDPKKAKIGASAAEVAQQQALSHATAAGSLNARDKITLAALKNAHKISEDAARALDPKSLSSSDFYPMDESAEFMLMDKTQFFENNGNIDFSMFDHPQHMFKQGLTSPTTVLAKDMGTDAHKLQLMKASFFIDDDIDNKSDVSALDHHDLKRIKSGGLFGKRLRDMYGSANSLWKETSHGLGGNLSEASSQVGYNSSPSQPISSVDSVVSVFKTQQQQTESDKKQVAHKLPPFIVKPKVAAIKNLGSTVPLIKSVAFPLRLKWCADLGLYNSRRFKLGFGPQITLIVPTTRNNLNREIKSKNLLDIAPAIFKSRAANDYSPTILQHLKISATQSYDHFKESIVDHLQIQLRNSQQQDVEGSECPFIKSDSGTELIVKHLDEAIKILNLGPLEEYAVSVWSLCLALWGDHDELEGRDAGSHFVIMYRRNLLSEWLENTLTDKDLLTKTVSKNTYLEHLLDLVMCHKVAEACELAFNYDDVNLSLLMAQLSSGPVVRQLMEDQLAAWNTDKADQFIDVLRLKLFMLVAGISLMASNHGVINCLESIEWIKVLGLQLWYLCPATSSITDALLAYEKSFKSEEFYSQPPTPIYMESVGQYNEKGTIYDLRYHLLQLFSKRSHPLESLLNPATHTSDPMDYRLSWLLLQTLEALGYHHCSELSESQLHVGFAAQLENNDLWEWSIFVLLHIKNKNQRELAVQNVLYRYVSVSKDVALNEKERFVINNLGVPEKWIDYAKAVRAGSLQNYHLQAKYLLKAKQWSLAHEIIFQHIAPDAVINDNLDYLHHLLMQFENPDLNKSIKVPNWSNQGQIFLDFIDINEKFKGLKSLKTEADIEARWKNLKPQLADLCSRINLLPCPTSKHRLCQSEIAQNLACLVRGVLLVCPILNPCFIIKIALERLPLPQEFAQQELRTLLDTLVGDLSKTQISNAEHISVK